MKKTRLSQCLKVKNVNIHFPQKRIWERAISLESRELSNINLATLIESIRFKQLK